MPDLDRMTDEEVDAAMATGDYDSDDTPEPEEEDEVEASPEPVETPEEEEPSDNEAEEEQEDDPDQEAEESGVKEEGEDEAEKAEEDSDTDDSDDPSTQIKELYTPFKANGVEMQVKSIAEARQLMQMGANYTKKMVAIKPYLQRAKTLEQNKLSDEDINLLVDLKKGDKGAIKKLLDDANIDALDLDLEDSSSYKATDYGITNEQFELTSVLEELKDSEFYDTTIDIVGNKWDDASRVALSSNPSLIKGIHEQVANGDYQIVHAAVERERALGRLTNVSDLEAYVSTFKKLQSEQQPQGQRGNANSQLQANPKSANKVDPKVAARKKAAASTQTGKKSSGGVQVNLDKMSDEEFLKRNADEFTFA